MHARHWVGLCEGTSLVYLMCPSAFVCLGFDFGWATWGLLQSRLLCGSHPLKKAKWRTMPFLLRIVRLPLLYCGRCSPVLCSAPLSAWPYFSGKPDEGVGGGDIRAVISGQRWWQTHSSVLFQVLEVNFTVFPELSRCSFQLQQGSILIYNLGKVAKKKKPEKMWSFAKLGGGRVSDGSKMPNFYFGKVFFQLACRIILGPPKHVLHLVWSCLNIYLAIKTTLKVSLNSLNWPFYVGYSGPRWYWLSRYSLIDYFTVIIILTSMSMLCSRQEAAAGC